MRKPVIFGNWKMNKTCAETVAFIKAVEPTLHDGATYGVGVPYTALKDATATADKLCIAAENCHFKDSGAFTGEISVPMLAELGVKYVIVGHSERRQMYNETDETVNLKVKRLFEANMTAVMCCGETEAQFDAGETEAVIRSQIKGGLVGLTAEQVATLILAYEPIWAIGTGKTATNEIADNCCGIVRNQVKVMFGEVAAEAVRIQYGGSVKPATIEGLMKMPNIDGALIGGAALQADSFNELVAKTK
jgi:triosephosphate isomerase